MITGIIINEQTLKRNSAFKCGTFEIFYKLGKIAAWFILEIPYSSAKLIALCMKCSLKTVISHLKNEYMSYAQNKVKKSPMFPTTLFFLSVKGGRKAQ